MANPEHLDILRQGVDRWNAWRERSDFPDHWKANLRGARLRGMDLRAVDFRDVDLGEANLQRANLAKANLIGAKLKQANLIQAKLSGARLSGANLSDANLSKAKLNRARLNGTILMRADLSRASLAGANLESAQLYETIFGSTNLSGAEGLDKCNHRGPSILDHRTVAKSGNLSLVFLRGCGLPDWLIEAYKLAREDLSDAEVADVLDRMYPLRTGRAIQFYSCFISYSSKDDAFADKLHDDLQEAGVRCWFAPEDLKIGDPFRDVIEDAVRLHDKVLLILSTASVKSEWVKDEVEAALEKERKRKPKQTVLFPLRIDDAIQRTRQAWASKLRRQRHIGDFRGWTDPMKYDTAFERLLRDLQAR